MDRIQPADVFTPRADRVNESMYIHRPDLERELVRALIMKNNIAIFGESGTGKSWLYKKILKERDIHFEIVNLANALQAGSIRETINYKIAGTALKKEEIEKR